MNLQRHTFQHNALTFSYLDSTVGTHVLVALHGHLMEAATFVPLAASLSPAWRVIALDQRGHGHSSHAPTYHRADYIGDLEALYVAEQRLIKHRAGRSKSYVQKETEARYGVAD